MFTTPLGSTVSWNGIHLSVADGLLLGGIAFTLCLIFRYYRDRPGRNCIRGILFVYCGALVAMTIPIVLPGDYHLSLASLQKAVQNINFVPFASSIRIYSNGIAIHDMSAFFRLILGNIALLMPIGVLVPMLHKSYRFWNMFAVSAATAFSIEFLQFLANVFCGYQKRVVEIDDFIQNLLGCLLAYGIYALVGKLFFGRRRKRR